MESLSGLTQAVSAWHKFPLGRLSKKRTWMNDTDRTFRFSSGWLVQFRVIPDDLPCLFSAAEASVWPRFLLQSFDFFSFVILRVLFLGLAPYCSQRPNSLFLSFLSSQILNNKDYMHLLLYHYYFSFSFLLCWVIALIDPRKTKKKKVHGKSKRLRRADPGGLSS